MCLEEVLRQIYIVSITNTHYCFNRIFPVALFCVENSIFSSKYFGVFSFSKYKYSAHQGRLLLFDPFWFILKEDTFSKQLTDYFNLFFTLT